MRSLKRKRSLMELMTARSPEDSDWNCKQSRVDEDSGIGQGRTGLTQEIQLIDLVKKSPPPSPVKPFPSKLCQSVFKTRYIFVL